jgi:hypothetical protein
MLTQDVIFLGSTTQIHKQYLNLGHVHLLLYPFLVSIHE